MDLGRGPEEVASGEKGNRLRLEGGAGDERIPARGNGPDRAHPQRSRLHHPGPVLNSWGEKPVC